MHQVRDAEHQRAGPDRSTCGSGASDAPEVPGTHELHHSQVAIHAHAGEEEDVGDAVHGGDVELLSLQDRSPSGGNSQRLRLPDRKSVV